MSRASWVLGSLRSLGSPVGSPGSLESLGSWVSGSKPFLESLGASRGMGSLGFENFLGLGLWI